MNTISTAQLAAYKLLRMDLYRHLDEAEFLAMKCDPWNNADAGAARDLIPELVHVIRTVLLEHREGDDGGCQLCAQPWPCQNVQTIHRIVTDPERQFVKLLDE